MSHTIPYSDFEKLELKTAKILNAEKVQGTDKLLKLELDAGEGEPRQIVSGIAHVYPPEELVGKTIVLLANLEPKKIRGVESRGMLLAADSDEGPILLMPEKEVKSGTKVR